MNVSVTQENPVMVKAEISIPWDIVAPHYNAALKDVKKHAQIPGFRKGKTPLALLKKRYHGHIVNDLSQKVISDNLEQTIKDEKIKAIGQPRVLDVTIKDKEALVYVVELDVLPEVTLHDYKGIEVERLIINVTDEGVDEELARLLEADTEKTNITDRAAQEGETVVISLTALDEEAGESLTDLDSYQIKMGAEDAHPALATLLADMKVDDDKAEVIEGTEDDSFDSWRGKKVKVFVEVKEIFQMTTPALDDTFAAKHEAENVDGLKSKTRERLEKDAADREEARMDEVLVGRVMEQYDFQLPEALVRAEAGQMVQQQMMSYMQMLQQQEPSAQKAFMESMMEYSMPQAAVKVRTDLVLDKIAEELKIEVADDEINEELEKMRAHYEAESVEALRAELEEKGTLDGLVDFMKRRGAVKDIRTSANTTMVEALTEVPQEEAAGEEGHVHSEHCSHDHDHEHSHEEVAEVVAKVEAADEDKT